MIVRGQTRSVASMLLVMLPCFILAGCINGTERTSQSNERLEISSGDCALLSTAAALLAQRNRNLVPPILSGCPGRYANRSRTENEKRAFTEMLANNPAPAYIIKNGVEVESLYNRLVSKGVPPELVIEVISSSLLS